MVEDTPERDEPSKSDEVIERLYEVAVDPSRYEALLDHWEAMIAPQRAAAPEGGDDTIGLRHLSGHVERADQVLDRVLKAETIQGADEMLGEIGRAAGFAVGRNQKILALNGAAEGLLGVKTGDRMEDLALGEGEAEHLAHHVARLLSANQDAPLVLRARTADSDRLVVFHLRTVRRDEAEPYVIVLCSAMQWPQGFTQMLRAAFEFTPAESDVVQALTEGSTLQQIAQDRGRSVDTIRAQLKSIMAKTETRSQTELVRLTLSTMDIAQYSEVASNEATAMSKGYDTLAPRPFQSLTLSDGRHMEYLILGDPKGAPVLFLPLDYGLVRWPAPAEAEATKRGIQIIVPVRAGYGNSTPLPKRTPYTEHICDDLAALMDHVGVAACPVLTIGADTHLAVHFRAAYPERMTALIACAGSLPLTRADQYDRMDKWHRFIMAGARYTPHLLPFMVKAGFALARKLGKRGFLHAVYGKSEADMEIIGHADVYEALVVGSDVCLSDTHSAHDAFSRAVLSQATSDWTDVVLAFKNTTPFVMMNGLQDPEVPPETLAEHRRDYPWMEFDIFPDAGQLLFFAKWPDVLDRLAPFLEKR